MFENIRFIVPESLATSMIGQVFLWQLTLRDPHLATTRWSPGPNWPGYPQRSPERPRHPDSTRLGTLDDPKRSPGEHYLRPPASTCRAGGALAIQISHRISAMNVSMVFI